MEQEIFIRLMTEDDAADIVRWRNSPNVVSNFIYRIPLTVEGHLQWMHTQAETGHVAQFVIVETATETGIGSVYLRDIDRTHKKAEFGIFIGEDCARGKGYGTIAAKLILEYAFETLQLNKVLLRVFAENTAAIKCYEKVGFRQEGLFREDVFIDDIPHDMVFMAILKSDWKGGCCDA